MGKICVLLVSLMIQVIFINVKAQDMAIDTFNIIEVEIVKNRLSDLSELDSRIDVDSKQISNYSSQNVSYLLGKTSLGLVTSNGPNGGLASFRIRGGSAEHTSVFWNGLQINSLTTGSADLSLINVGTFNQISVINGGSAVKYGSGSFGGAIELNNIPSFNKETSVSVNGEAGSFDTYRGNVGIKLANEHISYSGSLFASSSDNNFKFKDDFDFGKPIKTMQGADNRGMGTIHSLSVKLKNHLIQSGLWYQKKDYNIIPEMGRGEPVSSSNQKDSTFKAFVGWKYFITDWKFEFQSGYISDNLDYSQSGVAINEIGSKRSLNSLFVKRYLGNLTFVGGVKYNRLEGYSQSYQTNQVEHEGVASLDISLKEERTILDVSINKEWNSVTNPPVMFALSGFYKLIPEKMDVRAKITSHYRRPTFNERYWIPGGRTDLKAERGINSEVGALITIIDNSRNTLTLDQVLYCADNNEMLMWLPDSNGMSAPANMGVVLSCGSETKINYLLDLSQSKLTASLMYGFGKHIFNDKDQSNYKKDVYYKPRHLIRSWVGYERAKWDITLNTSFQSVCYTPDGFKMNSVFLADVIGNAQLINSKPNLKVFFRIENVLNANYQLIYKYAQPMRNYSLGINLII
nr:TonB-dependent receptor [uncultured Carboxylicivirga sp.]